MQLDIKDLEELQKNLVGNNLDYASLNYLTELINHLAFSYKFGIAHIEVKALDSYTTLKLGEWYETDNSI